MRFPVWWCHPAWVACPSADLARREASPWRLKMLEIRSGTVSQTHVKDWETFKDAHPSLPRKEWTRSSCRRILLQLSMVGLRELNLWKWNERSKPCCPHAIIYTRCTLNRILTDMPFSSFFSLEGLLLAFSQPQLSPRNTGTGNVQGSPKAVGPTGGTTTTHLVDVSIHCQQSLRAGRRWGLPRA